jgi:murein DD-endopeptidase MepM/ murein hydrolase activator NlpD
MKRGDFTVILARFAETPARKYTFSKRLVTSSAILLIVLISAFVLSSLHYYQMWKRTGEYDRLRVEVDQLRKENQTFRLSANQLTDRLSALEVVSKKLTILSGLDHAGMGGLGGPTSGTQMLNLNSRELANQLGQLNRKSRGMESDFRGLQDFYNNRTILLAATPAIMPVHGYLSTAFGYRADPFTGLRDYHPGIDISAPTGTKVLASADGLVAFADRQVGYGKLVVLQHKFGLSTRYGHLSLIAVKPGQRVRKGDIIGYVGSTGRATGPHLHYEVRLNDQPMNPRLFMRDSG